MKSTTYSIGVKDGDVLLTGTAVVDAFPPRFRFITEYFPGLIEEVESLVRTQY